MRMRSHRSLDHTVLTSTAWHRGGPATPPHILRQHPDTGEADDHGLCGTETGPPGDALWRRVGDDPGELCQRCFAFYLHNWDDHRLPYIADQSEETQ